jgi:hypothetical protein
LVQTTRQRTQGTLKEEDPRRYDFKVDETHTWCHPAKGFELKDRDRPSTLIQAIASEAAIFFGRTSMWRPRAPHLAHTTLLANDGISTSSRYFGGRHR